MLVSIGILTALILFIFIVLPKLDSGLERCPLGLLIGMFGLLLVLADAILIITEFFRFFISGVL
jgi:hypothetical protein